MRLVAYILLLAVAWAGAWGQAVDVSNYACDDGWTYSGSMVDGMRHGPGTAVSKKGNIYSGTWQRNRLPYGTLVAQNGKDKSEYEGQLNDAFAPHGFGTMRYVKGKNAGETYIGNFDNGNKSGYGRYIDSKGHVKFGKWANGVLKLPQGHSYAIGDRVYGIDLSHHNPKIDWNSLAIYCDSKGRVHDGNKAEIKSQKYVQPVSFVYARATEGATVTDSLYAKHTQQARRHAIPTGSYHMMCFTTSTAQQQIDNFLRATANCDEDDLPPMLDLENEPQARAAGPQQVQKMTEQWLKAVEKKTGRKPVIYTNDRFAAKYLDLKRLKGYTLWIARYHTEEPTTHPWYIWQFTEKGKISGINQVDLNYYDGNIKQFNKRMVRSKH